MKLFMITECTDTSLKLEIPESMSDTAIAKLTIALMDSGHSAKYDKDSHILTVVRTEDPEYNKNFAAEAWNTMNALINA
jgi:hypothetical protein